MKVQTKLQILLIIVMADILFYLTKIPYFLIANILIIFLIPKLKLFNFQFNIKSKNQKILNEQLFQLLGFKQIPSKFLTIKRQGKEKYYILKYENHNVINPLYLDDLLEKIKKIITSNEKNYLQLNNINSTNQTITFITTDLQTEEINRTKDVISEAMQTEIKFTSYETKIVDDVEVISACAGTFERTGKSKQKAYLTTVRELLNRDLPLPQNGVYVPMLNFNDDSFQIFYRPPLENIKIDYQDLVTIVEKLEPMSTLIGYTTNQNTGAVQEVLDITNNESPHSLTAATTGAGKTFADMGDLVQRIIERDVKGVQSNIFIIDPKGGMDWLDFAEYVDHLAITDFEMMKVIDMLVKEMNRRYKAIQKNRNVRKGFTPIYVYIDEAAELLETLGKEFPEIINNFGSLARLARACRVKLRFTLQRPDASTLPGEIKGNVNNRVLLGNADEIAKRMVLKQNFYGVGGRGHGFVSNSYTKETITEFKVPFYQIQDFLNNLEPYDKRVVVQAASNIQTKKLELQEDIDTLIKNEEIKEKAKKKTKKKEEQSKFDFDMEDVAAAKYVYALDYPELDPIKTLKENEAAGIGEEFNPQEFMQV